MKSVKETPLIDENLLDLLVCPITGEKLRLEGSELVGQTYRYEIKDGIPILVGELLKG